MSEGVLTEEFEVLESIYPTELTIVSERHIELEVEPEDIVDGADPFKLKLSVQYGDDYPEALPEFSLEPIEGELADQECDNLIESLRSVGKENLGMAMTFTVVSHLREELSSLSKNRLESQIQVEREKERLVIEAEEARTRGTPVTVESFKAWKAKFDKEVAQKKLREEEERLRALTAKERDETKKFATRLSGRQLFEKNRNMDDDESLLEEGTVSVDFSQYDRSQAEREEEEEDRVHFSDSD
ncbi:RWD-domain-containing protein [Coniophora puteana RWD-64-598 SS2]|uniref:RWD-domain-containing protein n=1 Tax=Coniophora puteana (strain RWD-64-598) TaxID=741705 RepID=A0A5M3N1L9_CONPW|nr:RWD-domain-containing protein [Coniophora puteana RWD-64-598 SS2]EIW85206.1 RWD-domain-containing protein [Coniophora puteana RWD-64-598 SS2]